VQYLVISLMAILFLMLEKAWWAMLYIPSFPIFYVLNFLVQPVSLVRAIAGSKARLNWHKPTRYQL
jgi:hypothetical protein